MRGIVIRNKARLFAQVYTQEEGIDYDKIEDEVYVCQPLGFKDLEFHDNVYKVEKALYGLHQAHRVWYETLSTYLLDNGFQRGQIDKTLYIKRVNGDILLVQKDDGIFISQDNYVDEILKKFGFSTVKRESTPMETSKPLLKDAEVEDVDVHLYRLMIGSLMYLSASRPDIMFVFWQTATASTLDNGEIEITATIDGKVKLVTEASIRRHLKLEDSDGTLFSLMEIFDPYHPSLFKF
ncbi:putative ribonuclease H-like domain-containing protein [Tanacetum coccineum]